MNTLGTILKTINPGVQEDALQYECVENDIESLQYDGLENLAGYICHKLKNQNPNLAANPLEVASYTWVNHLSEGGLIKPSSSLVETLRSCDAIFFKLNGEKLLISNEYLQKHLLEAKDIQATEEVKKLFFRCRMYFRMRLLNAEISQNINKRKRKLNKTTT